MSKIFVADKLKIQGNQNTIYDCFDSDIDCFRNHCKHATANAHTPPWTNVPTWSYIVVSPNPVGIGQTASLCSRLIGYRREQGVLKVTDGAT